MSQIDKIRQSFREPDRRYAVYQIIHGGAADPQRAAYYDERWFGGIVGNVNYPMDFPDNPEIWKSAETGIREYIRRGMHTWLYDEKGYPSGTAGGYVTEYHPEYIAKGLYCYDYWRKIGGPGIYRADVPGDTLWKAVLIPTEGGDPIDVTDCLNERGVLYVNVPAGTFYLFMMSIRRLFDGTHATESYSEPRNYISLSDKAATEAFIACTHEKYKEVLGDQFGKGVLAMFTDEPSLISWNIRKGVFPILPWLDSYPADFEKKYGYEFYKACVAVVLARGNDVTKRRCDFWEFIADTVADSYFGTIQDWCHANHLKSSGHMLEEERLQAHVYNYGSFYRSMKRFDWPGIDQLQTETGALMNDGAIPIARFIASFADINGEHEVFTEFSDHSVRERGAIAGLDCYYGSVNWHLAMGVNNFTSYYSWNGITKEETAAFNRYTARSGFLLRQGCRDSKVAVFYPEAAMWDSYTPSTEARAIDHSDRTRRLDKAFVKASWDLIHRQIDFDYIDRELLCEAEIRDGRLCFADRAYSAVVMPCARVLEEAAMEKLLTLQKAGIDVFFCEELPVKSRETGGTVPAAGEIAQLVEDGKMYFAPTDGFSALLDEKLAPVCRTITTESDNGTYQPMLLSHCRITEEGLRIVYIANMAAEPYTGILHVNGTYSRTCEADAFSGEIMPAECTTADDTTTMQITIQPGEGRFFLLQK
ncbi:MAG: hypothetical protein E7631_09550 [Ruminococcaceae bacterium]|nr:hypothetical protein [Oscillospiraceae bacterium]